MPVPPRPHLGPTVPACPRCLGTGKSEWVQPGGKTVPVRCSACAGCGQMHDDRQYQAALRAERKRDHKKADKGFLAGLFAHLTDASGADGLPGGDC